MYALSIPQPLAAALVDGVSAYLPTFKQTSYHGPLLIHASHNPITLLTADGREPLKEHYYERGCRDFLKLPRSALVGQVFLQAVLSRPQVWDMEETLQDPMVRDPFLTFYPYFWVVKQPLAFRQPVCCSAPGSGLFRVRPALLNRCRAQLIVRPTTTNP